MGTLVLCLNFALFLIPGVLSGGYGGYRGGLGYLNNRLKGDARRNWLNDLKNSMRDRRYWDKDEEAWNLLDRIERESTTKALEDLEDLLGELDHRYRGLSQDILRRLIKKYNLTEPMVYTAYSNQLSSSSAEKYCLSKGKRIAVIRNALEHSLARQAALALSQRKVYIGLHYSASRKFYWSDGTNFTYHRVDELSASHGCYVMKVNSGDWISTACSNKFPFLCETKPNKTQSGQAFPTLRTTQSPRKPTPNVPPRTDGHQTRTSGRYLSIPYPMNGTTAEKVCRRYGYTLATIHSQAQQNEVHHLAQRTHSPKVYIGLKNNRGSIYWHDRSPVNFTNYGMQIAMVPPTLYCYVMDSHSGKWFFVPCTDKWGVICEDASHSSSSSRSTTKRPSQIAIDVTMDVDYQQAMASPNFQTDMIKVVAAALRIPESRVRITGLRSGSTIVSFTIELADSDTRTTNDLRATLEMAAAEGKLTVMVNGKPVHAKKNILIVDPEPPEQPSAIVPAMICVVLGILIIAIIVGLFIWYKKRKVTRSTPTVGPTVTHTVNTARCQVYAEVHDEKKEPLDDLPEYTGPPPEADAPPKYYDCVA